MQSGQQEDRAAERSTEAPTPGGTPTEVVETFSSVAAEAQAEAAIVKERSGAAVDASAAAEAFRPSSSPCQSQWHEAVRVERRVARPVLGEGVLASGSRARTV